ncbi:MAG: DUF72 domain-containing protein, partial [Verrucomicrobia bacterium]|nr:DUF72 domain-containing protein [Verrucomicrobiota bacterium]
MADLFSEPQTSFKAKLQGAVQSFAASGIYIGTSSWKYSGWTGLLYDPQRYCYRGKFAESRFERDCLAEYAETFKTVCVDAAYYQFPSAKYLDGLVSKVPADFRFTFKVTDDITLKRFTNLPRFGIKAGKANNNFLNADLFNNAFLKPCEPFRSNIGLLMFEFSRFYSADYEHGRDFIADLDGFLSKLPEGWNYGVEIRNQEWLQLDYFAVLRKHGVVHVFNNWSRMPTVGEQMVVPGSNTSDAVVAARFLLKPGRSYEEAVEQFSPYKAVKEVNEEARAAGRKLIIAAKQQGKKAFIYVNNRLEG